MPGGSAPSWRDWSYELGLLRRFARIIFTGALAYAVVRFHLLGEGLLRTALHDSPPLASFAVLMFNLAVLCIYLKLVIEMVAGFVPWLSDEWIERRLAAFMAPLGKAIRSQSVQSATSTHEGSAPRE